ncbi:MAG: hypothetical protein HYY17_13715 [Planctomycetes bacterium]|nr:hypothetical protein [Planctomycetota bacterium]
MGRKGVVLSFWGVLAFALFVVAVSTIADRSGETPARTKRVKSPVGDGDRTDLALDPTRARTTTTSSETTPGSDATRSSEAESARQRTKPILTDSQAWTLRTAGRYSPARDVGKVWHSWPEKETKVEPPASEPAAIGGGIVLPSKGLAATATPESSSAAASEIPEPPAPTPERIREVSSWAAGSEDTLGLITALLANPAEPSTLKLIGIEKLRAYPAERVVPILTTFLSTPAPAGGAYTKPTAVKVLFDLGATDTLAGLAASATDPRVKLAIASLSR